MAKAKTLVRVITQYWENYGDKISPHWKPKGRQEFHVFVDVDVLMYAEKEFASVIDDLLGDHYSNDRERHTYVSQEPVFHTPIVIDQAIFDKMLDDYTQPETRDPETVVFSAMQ